MELLGTKGVKVGKGIASVKVNLSKMQLSISNLQNKKDDILDVRH